MQIITVAPVVRGVLQAELTYFSKEPLTVGMVVVVPVRNREVPAIIIESRGVSDAKEAIKTSDYAMRKITRAKPRRIWTPVFLKAVEETANFSVQKLGETLLSLTPKTILDAHIEGTLDEPSTATHKNKFEILAIQGDTKTRLGSYQRLVRESFVHKESVFVCLPTEDDVERVAEELGHGIEDYTVAFHSSVSKKRILERWQKAVSEKHAILVVGTAQYLGIPRYFKTIVLDEEHSHAWKMMVRPLLDLRIFIENYARANKSTLIVGAPILRAETQSRIADGAIGEFDRIVGHTLGNAETAIIDPRIEEKMVRENTGKREMIVISNELKEILAVAHEKKERVFLLVARKGLSPITSCGDCGTLVRCPECDTPLVIHKKEQGKDAERIFICHGCGLTRVPEDNANETCPKCGSWRLQGVGIGIDRIEEEISSHFPDTPLFVLDGDRAKTRTQAKKIIAQFEKSAGGILVATPMAIPLLDTVEHTAIVSIDSLFAIPDIRMSERIFALVLALREKTNKTLLIQTRADDTTIFEQALQGNLAQFAENELALRKAFSYPPYGTIIKITLRGKRADVAPEMDRLKTFLADHAPIVPGTMAREPKNIFRMHMILKLAPLETSRARRENPSLTGLAQGAWNNSNLLAKLRALPPQFTIEVNPDHLL